MAETSFGELLRQLRAAAGLSQEELAARAGLSAQAVSALERGLRRAPYRQTIDALANALDLGAGDRAELITAGRRRGAPASAAVAERASTAAPPPSLSAPAIPADLIGRAVPFAEIVALLRHAGARLLTITGPGGVGKTRLALAVAGALAPDYANGAAVVPLADLREPAQVAGQIAGALGLEGRAGDPVTALIAHLHQHEALLLLDNFEHLLAAAPLIAALLDACPRLTILATSRTPLRLGRERAYPLAPLDCPDPAAASPAALAEYGATALFVARARVARPGFTLTPANAAIVAAVCARLDGLPLAIELAAARLGVLGPAELRDRLDRALPLLTRGARDLPERQRTLRAALDWSHDLLNAGERALFRRLSIFTGGATLPAIEAVCAPPVPPMPELLDWLDGLVEQGLVRCDFPVPDAPPRFVMLETIREYAAERLAAHNEGAALRRAHTAHFLALAEEAAPELTGADQERWDAILVADHDNLRAALRAAIDQGDVETATRLAAALWRFWYSAGHWAEGRRWLAAVLALPDAEGAPPAARATVLRAAGGLALMQADFGPAQENLSAALALARRAGDDAGAATALDYLAILAKERNDYRTAIDLHAEALAARRVLGVPRDIAVSLNNLGAAHEARSDYHAAALCFDEAAALSRAAGDTHTRLIALINLGNVVHHLGDYARARALCSEGLALARRLGDGRYAALALTNLGTIALDRGDPAAAADIFRESIALSQPLDALMLSGPAYANLGEALRLLGDREGAAAATAEGLAIAARAEDDWAVAIARLYRGSLAADNGDRDAALADYRAAIGMFRAAEASWGLATALNRLAALTPDRAEAVAALRESLGFCAAMKDQLLGAGVLDALAALAVADDPARAARLLALADATRDRLGTPREPALAARRDRTLAAARAALGPAALAAALADGRARDLDAVLREG